MTFRPLLFLAVVVFSNMHILWHTDADGALNSKPEIIVTV